MQEEGKHMQEFIASIFLPIVDHAIGLLQDAINSVQNRIADLPPAIME